MRLFQQDGCPFSHVLSHLDGIGENVKENDGFSPKPKTGVLGETFGHMSEQQEVTGELWERSAAIDETMQYACICSWSTLREHERLMR